ncbi:MAG: ABC transporter permease, partial [Promicromonosporaceae bacterium]|nr:ABC transporter permease [Promicromonosporaceae bacterium]
MATPATLDAPDAEALDVPEAQPARRSWFSRSAPMLTFLGQRLLSALIVMLGATFIVYMLLSYAVNPLEDLLFSQDPNRDMLIAERTQLLRLDLAPPVRYLMWLGNAVTGNLGASSVTGASVTSMLGSAIPTTVTLVSAATVLAIVLGILVGIVSALRQYTRFDYSVTFISFVLFSLPSFWVAVLAKLYGAIGFNDFLADPHFAWYVMIIVPLVSGVVWSAIIGGSRKTRWISFAASAVVTFGAMFLMTATDWLQRPTLGYLGVALIGLGAAFALTAMVAGLQNRRALYSALTTAAVGVVLMYPLQWAFQSHVINWGLVVLLALSALVAGCVIGWLYGGFDRSISMRISALVALITGLAIFFDRIMSVWPFYNRMGQVLGRPIPTMGASRPGLSSAPGYDFWIGTLDSMTHLILPTITLLLISFAGYTRYSRASL